MGAAADILGQRDEEGEEEIDMGMGPEEEPMDDIGAEEEPMDDLEDAGGEGRMVSVDDFMGALESALEDVMGEPTSVEMSDEEGDEALPGDDAEMGMDAEMGELGPEEDEDALQEDKSSNKGHGPGKEAKDGNGKPSGRWLKEEEEDEDAPPRNEEEIVNEVARRVAARLVNEKKKKDVAEQLADRILKRLTK